MESSTLRFVGFAAVYLSWYDIGGIAAVRMPHELVPVPLKDESPSKVPGEFDLELFPDYDDDDLPPKVPHEEHSPPGDIQEFFTKRVFLPYDSSTPDADESQRIVDGYVTSTAVYPHQVWMSSSIGLCGGSLISLQTVLTAAHCVVDGESVTVTFGRSATQPNGVLAVTGTAKRHPDYDKATLKNDVALVILANPVTTTTNIRPARINTSTKEFLKWVTITGYGLTEYGGTVQTALRAAPVTVTGTDGPSVLELSNLLDWLRPYKTSCQGDSGGPATFAKRTYALVVGITSYGYGEQCGGTGPQGGWFSIFRRRWVNKSYYTRVSSFTTWILANSVGTVETGSFLDVEG